jgi:chemotaxis protein MotB
MTRSERDDARDLRDGLPERGWMDLALAAYAEPLARGRTVLFVGDPQSPAAARLGEAAARLEVVPTGGRQRPSRAGRGTLRSHAENGEWDVVWLLDAAAVVADPAQLREVAEALSPRGAALLAVEADPATYEALYASLRAQFEHVRMLGQAPFAGQSIVDFAAAQREPALSFDGSIVGDEGAAPARYVAVCSARAISLEAHTIVQLPVEESASAGEARRDLEAARARLEHSERRLEQAQREIARSGQKIDELRHEHARSQTELGQASERAAELAARLEAVEVSLREAEHALSQAAANEDAEGELAELEASLHARAKEIVELREELARRALLVRDILEAGRGRAPGGDAPAASAPPGPSATTASAPVAATGESGVELRALREALVGAQRRAVDAEAARAAAVFARDEAADAAEKARQALQADVAQHAREAGRARGLTSRVAELEELRGLLEARVELLHADLREARLKLRDAQRDTELAREQYELALTRARAVEHEAQAERVIAAEATPSETTGSTPPGASDVSAEAASALARLRDQLEIAEASRLRAEEEASRLRTSLELLESQSSRDRTEAGAQLAAIEATLASERSAFDGRLEAFTRESGARIDELTGEVSGLRMLLADLEAARAALEARPAPSPGADPAELASLREQLERVSAAHQAGLELRQMTAARADAEAARAIELAQRVLALDGLASRLQSALAQEAERSASARRALRAVEGRLAEAVEARDALEAVQVVRLEAERRTATELEQRAAASEAALAVARRVNEVLRVAVTEARALLSETASRLPAGGGGGASDPALRERVEEMRRAIEDRDILLRSLTAQLQDKDDRIRGLETTLRREAPRGAPDVGELRAAVSERDERIARLRAELQEARAKEARLEATHGSMREREAELRRLQGAIADRDTQLMALEGRAIAAERDQREMRETFASARAQLEVLLGDTRVRTSVGEAGEHIAELVRLLRRF